MASFIRYGRGAAACRRASRVALVALVAYAAGCALAAAAAGLPSLADHRIALPEREQVIRLLTLRDYNTRVVLAGVMLLGMAGGIIGTFMLLRKRALMGDAVSHATLPGIAIAFLVMTAAGGDGKSLPGLLLGALLSGLVGMGLILGIRQVSRIKEDAALGIVLSVFFGIGVALLGVIQKRSQGSAAGLESFIYGKTASMLAADAALIGVMAVVVIIACAAFYKEFGLLCFDQAYAAAQGWPVVWLDIVMMGLVVVVTVIGLQAVGLILVIALLITPAAAARFWTDHLFWMLLAAALIGAASGLAGGALSALFPRLSAGAIIVVVAAGIFFLSMIFGPARGVLGRTVRHVRLRRRVLYQNLLRALFEWREAAGGTGGSTVGAGEGAGGAPLSHLLAVRSWSPRSLRRQLRRAIRANMVYRGVGPVYDLTDEGFAEARSIVRNHRLWELFLITHADVAPSRVDRHADEVEHVLGPAMADELNRLLADEHPELAVPPSPHAAAVGSGDGQ